MYDFTATIPPSDNVTLNLNGHSLPGFKRGETWNGLVKYTKGQNYVILEDVNPQPEAGYTIIKMNPALADKVKTPPTAGEGAGNEGGALKVDGDGDGDGEGDGAQASGATA